VRSSLELILVCWTSVCRWPSYGFLLVMINVAEDLWPLTWPSMQRHLLTVSLPVNLWQAKLIQRHLTVVQLSRCADIHHDMSVSQRLELVAELCRHYDAGLHLGPLQLLVYLVLWFLMPPPYGRGHKALLWTVRLSVSLSHSLPFAFFCTSQAIGWNDSIRPI